MMHDEYGTWLYEGNWQQVTTNLTAHPFRLSAIRNIENQIPLTPLAFKFNLQGAERYANGHEEVHLRSGDYLLAVNQSYCEVSIRQETEDLGLCVDMDTELLKDALHSLYQPDAFWEAGAQKQIPLMEEDLFMRFSAPAPFKLWIHQLYESLRQGHQIPLFQLQFEFTRQFLIHHHQHWKYYRKIPAVKPITRQLLYAKMQQAREILHDYMKADISMPQVAAWVQLSPYRFYHLFQQTYEISPYQYFLQLKLNYALEQYKTGRYTWTEIAFHLGFPDLACFSKQFKKCFGLSPQAYARQKNLTFTEP